jgi:hypothetical protein
MRPVLAMLLLLAVVLLIKILKAARLDFQAGHPVAQELHQLLERLHFQALKVTMAAKV